ncbi:DegT/DnrJ/EryC1/StrS family aminotransferase [Patescibacteria group bacterium]|nr:DegT/DnrJ/EryC1/StrS family aminotransferase [Patescibacteria group bacterium]MBU4458388.1 DegT/DnrJ/EryC1/StrS family aminotransferase [Patescibacteria group bacterium]MCG2695857.1 DegT/DnrJ/EryC1/StrS family aminotransferase [Candidatus Portnoybacteria bacterium]
MYFAHPQFKKFPLRVFFRKFSEADLKNKLAKIFPDYQIIFTNSGRSAFRLAIQQLNLENSEMIMPAYICDILKPILEKYNIKPVYLDTNLKTFHADSIDIESKITPLTKSILICHTYGLPIEMDRILGIAKKYNLKIIEDCAHIAPPMSPEKFGDALFFSFAKLFPVINGGMLICKNQIELELPKYKSRLFNIVKFLRLFPMLAGLSELFRRINPPSPLHLRGYDETRKASKGCLKIVNYYLDNLETNLNKRINLAKYFQKKLTEIGFEVPASSADKQESENNTFTYLSALVPKNTNRDELFNKLRKKGIFCSRIWQKPLFNEFPNTAETAKRIINFPLQNWFTEKDINKITDGILSSMG